MTSTEPTQEPQQAVTFAPDGWDDKTWAPVDEQVESLAKADAPDDDLPDWYGNFCLSCNYPHPPDEHSTERDDA